MLDSSVVVETPKADVSVARQADGSVIIDLETHRSESKASPERFDANLADSLDDQTLSQISNEVLDGINADIASRADWLNNYNKGMALLGLLLEEVSSGDKTVSKVRHPLLLWSIIKFQALTQGEVLPSNGPVKIKNDGAIPGEIVMDLEKSWNYYMTTVMTEYYPDTDRALFYLGYGGTIFKKVFKDPIKRRPTSAFVALPDLIVSQDAIDLTSAQRVTHRIEMLPNQVRRYQKMKFWRKIDLPPPVQRVEATDEAEAKYVTGVNPNRTRQEDWSHTIYETATTLDLPLKEPGKDEGIELPYIVTIDSDSQQILAIRRNWRKGDATFQPKQRFVKWGLIPSIGFLCLGYLHLLGNHTKALTALERIIIDAGMFSNFPGGVRVKGIRSEGNTIQPGPGEFVEIDTNGLPVEHAIKAMPFKGPDATMLALLQGLEAQGEKTAGQIELKTGEGSADIPVGTIIAMIEQSTQIMTAVHRRLHQAQAEELRLLQDLIKDEPTLLHIPGVQPRWSPEHIAAAGLTPASNPNVPAQVHRIMQAVVLETLAQSHPELYNTYEVQRRILEIAKVPNIESVLMEPVPTEGPQDPTLVLGLLQSKIAEMQLQLRKEADERKAKLDEAELVLRAKEAEVSKAKTASEVAQRDEELRLKDKHHAEDLADRAADRQTREETSQWAAHDAREIHAQDLAAQMDSERIDRVITARDRQEDRFDAARERAEDRAVAQADRDFSKANSVAERESKE